MFGLPVAAALGERIERFIPQRFRQQAHPQHIVALKTHGCRFALDDFYTSILIME
jgi:hypothetical protein